MLHNAKNTVLRPWVFKPSNNIWKLDPADIVEAFRWWRLNCTCPFCPPHKPALYLLDDKKKLMEVIKILMGKNIIVKDLIYLYLIGTERHQLNVNKLLLFINNANTEEELPRTLRHLW